MTAKTSDILIIGGGIAGISAAALMSGEARVTVIEAESAIGYHASGRSAAIFIRNYGNSVLRALNSASEGFLTQPEGVSDFSLLSPRGELLIADEDELEVFATYVAGSDGLERLTAKEALGLVPILREDRLAAVALERGARDIDVDRMLQGFARLLKRRGGTIVTSAQAMRIARSSGVWRVTTGQDEFTAPVLVNAAGAWADRIAAMAGVRPRGLKPFRRSAAIIPPPSGLDVSLWPLFASVSERFYAKPEAGKLMISPADEEEVEPHDVFADDMVIAQGLARYEAAVSVPVNRVVHTWAGIRSFFADRTPAVGFSQDAEGFFWLAGQGGYGMQTAPALSQLAADLCLLRVPSLDNAIVTALNPNRAALTPSACRAHMESSVR